MPELFDVVDDQDHVLRQEPRADVHRQRLLHRAVHVLVFNSKGEVYLQRRSAKKDTYPHRWTTACSGHVDAGEDYDTAAVRELQEELGLKGATIAGTKGSKHLSNKGQPTKNQELRTKTPGSKALHSSPFTLHPFQRHPPCRETGWEFIWIYTLTTDVEPTPDPAEISEGRWITPTDFDAWIVREPKAFTPSFILVWKLWRKQNP